MALRIGCDLDGTLADMHAALDREADGFDPAGEARRRGSRQRRLLWSRIAATEDFWTTLQEVEPGAVAHLAAEAVARRWEIIFLTQRPPTAGDTVQRQSQRWLEAHGFEHPSVFVVSGSRGRIAAALELDVVIDDRPENCLDVVADSDATSLLVWRHAPETAPPGASRLRIDVVTSMAEAIERMKPLSKEPSRASAFDRVRKVLRPLWGRPLSANLPI